jgi:hypothetical protein
MNGKYLQMAVDGHIVGPIIAFREYIFRDVPAFGNLDLRAQQVADDYYNCAGSQPIGEYQDFDMADAAEAARDRSLSWYELMTSLRQTMRNLLAAGLFHLVEQQLATLCRDGLFRGYPVPETKLSNVAIWYQQHLRLEFASLPSWNLVEELRLVANAVKHGEGQATKKLEILRPEIFMNPDCADFYKDLAKSGLGRRVGRVSAPLAGEDLFVSELLLRKYAEGAESFFHEIAAHLEAHDDDY